MKMGAFNELSWENLGQWPLSIKKGVLLGMITLILGLGYGLIIKTRVAELHRLKMQEDVLKIKFEEQQKQLYNLPKIRAQLHRMRRELGLLLKQLPKKNEMPSLLEELSKTGSLLDLTLDQVIPQPEILHSFYSELPIKVKVEGGYFQTAHFISQIASLNRMITIDDFVLAKNHQERLDDKVVMMMTIIMYQYRAS